MSRIVVRATLWVSLCVVFAGCNSRPSQSSPIDPRQTLAFLASDELEGRGVGTPGLDRAADYIAARFRAMGLKPLPGERGYFQPFQITTATEIGPRTRLRVGDREFTPKEDFAPIAFSAESGFSGPVVFVGYGIRSDEHAYDDFAGIDLQGNVALAMRYEPQDEKGKSRFAKEGWSDAASVASKAKLARDHGAIALLLVTPPKSKGDDRLMALAQRPMVDPPTIPILHVKQAVAEDLLRRAQSEGLKSLQQRIDADTAPASFALPGVEVAGNVQIKRTRTTVKNVAGYVPGKRAKEFVVVGAHYDHLGRGGIASLALKDPAIHNGADDNASGTTALLQLAQRFATSKSKPERSLIFIAFTAEEQGLLGSQRFVEHSPVPLESIVSMLNLDMVGRIRALEPATTSHGSTTKSTTTTSSTTATAPSTTTSQASGTTQPSAGVLYLGGAGTAPSFDGIVRQADERSPLQVKDIGRGGIGPSDHMSFAVKRIPVLFLFSGMHADYHRPTDDADTVNYEGLAHVVDFAHDLLTHLVAAPAEKYVAASDASPMRVGSGSSNRVTLGVVPDYSSFGQSGGVRITGTAPGSPAAEAGLQAGDLIVRFNDATVDTLQDLSEQLAKGKAGEKVKLQVLRGGSSTPVELTATLAQRKD